MDDLDIGGGTSATDAVSRTVRTAAGTAADPAKCCRCRRGDKLTLVLVGVER